jgi:tetratricopeptide (TPR) repeat protein
MDPIRPDCACGSGLKADRCCALDWTTTWPEAAAELERARAAAAEGEAQLAEQSLLAGLDRAPLHQGGLGLLYGLRKAQGRDGAAEALLRRLARLGPDNPAPAVALALRLVQKGAFAEAEPFARNALRLTPDDPLAHNLMGTILTEARRPQPGERHYRRALALVERPNAALLADLAWNLKTQGRIDEARDFYRRSAALNPNRFNTLYGWARTEEADRRFDRAAELLDAAERLAPGHPHARLQRAVLHARQGRPSEALALIAALEQGAAAADGQDIGLRLDLMTEKGAVLDTLGRPAEAFAAFAEAKRAMRRLTGRTYMAEAAAAQADRLARFFTAPRMAGLPRAEARTDVAQPIFIVGFPRSGTTMIEQTLSGHPAISAGDELPVVGELIEQAPRLMGGSLPYPEILADPSVGDAQKGLNALRDRYLDRARALGAIGEGAAWFTDKMPLNETHLGLISLIFPAAPVIHLIRHPLDVALSVYANQMTHGFHCADDLVSIARHYLLTADLVDHYRREIPLRYLAVRYEDVVGDQQAKVREMLAFIGAPFDSRCLDFHENRRYARTASYAQVTEKLHDRSRYRYRAYREQLAPVIPMLEPAIRRLGYALD